MKSNAVDVDHIEKQVSGCKTCKQKKKKCRTCKSSKIKINWMLFLSFYFLIFIIWGHIEFIKFLRSLF
jgi:hypothetical protein